MEAPPASPPGTTLWFGQQRTYTLQTECVVGLCVLVSADQFKAANQRRICQPYTSQEPWVCPVLDSSFLDTLLIRVAYFKRPLVDMRSYALHWLFARDLAKRAKPCRSGHLFDEARQDFLRPEDPGRFLALVTWLSNLRSNGSLWP